jgi:hypothetical protein
MKLLFGSFKIVIDAIEAETGDDVGIQIECNPKNRSFTMTTQRKNNAAAEIVDLTKGEKENGKEAGKDKSFSSAGANIPYFLFSETDTPNTKEEAAESEKSADKNESESDNEVEFIGCNKEKHNASLCNQSDTSSEYEAAVSFSQEVFTYIPRIPGAAPRRSQRTAKANKGNKAK